MARALVTLRRCPARSTRRSGRPPGRRPGSRCGEVEVDDAGQPVHQGKNTLSNRSRITPSGRPSGQVRSSSAISPSSPRPGRTAPRGARRAPRTAAASRRPRGRCRGAGRSAPARACAPWPRPGRGSAPARCAWAEPLEEGDHRPGRRRACAGHARAQVALPVDVAARRGAPSGRGRTLQEPSNATRFS